MLKVVRREGCGGGRFWKGAWQHLVLLALTLKYFVGSGMRDLFLTNSQVLLSFWFFVSNSKSRGCIALQSHWMTSSWPFSPFSRIPRGLCVGSKLSSSLESPTPDYQTIYSRFSWYYLQFPLYDEKQSTSHMDFIWEPCEVGSSWVLGLI